MVKVVTFGLPDHLEQFFQQLRSLPCSEKWDWKRIHQILLAGDRNINAFSPICEAGIYHLLHSKSVNKDSTVKCNHIHACGIATLQLAGASFASLMFTGIVAKKADKFKDLLSQTCSSIIDSLTVALEILDFPHATLKPLRDLQNLKIRGMPRLIPLERQNVGAKKCIEISLGRLDVLSSVLRTVFEHGSFAELPVCVPYICSLMSATLSVNLCDPRHSTPALISCARRLIHCFAVIISSCGIHLSPVASVLTTGLIYQLEWSSNFANTSPSDDSFTYRLAIYRCLSCLIEASRYTFSTILVRLLPRIFKNICEDISYISSVGTTQSCLTCDENARVLELKMCCAVAALRIVEHIFGNHSFTLKSIVCSSMTLDGHDENSLIRLKQTIRSLHCVLENAATYLISLHRQSSILSDHQRLVLIPQLLLPFIHSVSAMTENGFVRRNVCSFRELIRLSLHNDDPILRRCTQRCFRRTFLCTEDCHVVTMPNADRLSAIASVQTDDTSSSEAFTQIENDLPFVSALTESLSELPVAVTIPNPSSHICSTSRPVEKRVRFLEDLTPLKKRREDQIPLQPVFPEPENAPPISKIDDEKCSDQLPMEDVLCTFDDTLI